MNRNLKYGSVPLNISMPSAASYATGHDCQSPKRRLKPSFFRQLPKVFGLLTFLFMDVIFREFYYELWDEFYEFQSL
ncbi:hypothetical protein [uncultured Nostoc sp.]|uniref:hypothetical protein n=1 Tax=uncultured Nostoc sp. TaxID=340711 RepID=UPI0035C99143